MRALRLTMCSFLVVSLVSSTFGDWGPDDPYKMHYPQLPDPWGWDICVYDQWVADDFECTEDGPITDIHFWISWLDDVNDITNIQSWDISIWSDATGGPGNCLMQPGQRLWTWQGDGNVTIRWEPVDGDQGWHCPRYPTSTWEHNHGSFYQVNITDIQETFTQVAGTVYWLVIKVNLYEPQPVSGWKTSTDAWRCRALWSTGPGGAAGWSLVDTGTPLGFEPVYHDMAFVITGEQQHEEYLEHCDAPEGSTAVAYPSTGVTGSFPTCVTGGPAGFIQHNNFGAWLGPAFEFEWEGDAGLCPPPGCFPTYDDDECFADGDAGLLIPEAYTIDAFGAVVPCPLAPSGGTPLGIICQQAVWGQDIDIEVHNHMPSDTIGFVNVMCDWVQDGDWGDTASCGTNAVPEHVLQNFQIPNPYDGPISALMAAGTSFQIGPNSGYVWMRVSITEQQVPVPWDGSGVFEDGESEAYLILVDGLDWGDAPDNYPVGGGYPTLSGNNGANHLIGGPWLGDITDSPDSEPDGQPDPVAALGDDQDMVYPPINDDEDGVQVPVLKIGQADNITFEVNSGGAGAGGVVDMWIDWNGNMSWLDAGEQIIVSTWYPDGIHVVNVTPPAASVVGQTFLRARISTMGGLPPDGFASDGEVEDHEVYIEEAPPELDWGDAPDPTYPTLSVSTGASHVIVSGVYLGAGVDAEPDGQPDPAALGDDMNLIYPGGIPWPPGDEDGVVFTAPLIPGTWANINVTANVAGALDAWVDFEGDGNWSQAINQIFASQPLVAGANPLSFWVPGSASPGTTFARFRFSLNGGLGYRGQASDGEVEDYEVQIVIPENKPLIKRSKWSQPPIEISPDSNVPYYCGWDEISFNEDPAGNWKIVADDFRCLGNMPVTSVHWWGSYWGWLDSEPVEHYYPALNAPVAWRIGFWSNVPNYPGGPGYSYPETLLWQVEIPSDRVTIDWVGVDEHPDFEPDTCFQYYVDLEETEWFWQGDYTADTPDSVFWISIAAVYDSSTIIEYPWGWKTRPWHWMDDAVTFYLNEDPLPGLLLDPAAITPIEDFYFGESWDVAFELDTDPCYVKWDQPYTGIRDWPHYEDELSMAREGPDGVLNIERLVADDWLCERNTPITAAVWWGSYIGYRYEACGDQLMSRPVPPDYFMLSIWTDVAADDPDNQYPYSHPGEMIWDYQVYDYDEVLVGYDKHPEEQTGPPREPVFRYSVRIPETEQFCQEEPDTVYWFSAVAVYSSFSDPIYDWGWTNHEHVFNDDAVAGTLDPPGGWFWEELYDQTGTSEDMSFTLFTEPEECCPCKGDISDTSSLGPPDGKVNTGDMAALLTNLILYGDSLDNYNITGSPIQALLLRCMDVTDTTSIGPPDGRVDTGDMAALLTHLILYGDAANNYEAPCM